MMFIIMLSRRYLEAADNFAEGRFYDPIGYELENRTLGIVGFGASGQALARRGEALRHADHGHRRAGDRARGAGRDSGRTSWVRRTTWDRVVAESDFLSLHLHLNDETRHIIDARRLARMKPTASIVNVARGRPGGRGGPVRGARRRPHRRRRPGRLRPGAAGPDAARVPAAQRGGHAHIAGVTDGTARRRAAAAAENTDRIARGLEPLYRIDL